MNKKKINIAILGSTGSIGRQALSVIKDNKDLFEVEVLTAATNADLLIKRALEFSPQSVVITDENKYSRVAKALENSDSFVFAGKNSLNDVVKSSNIDIILSGIVGVAGLEVAVEAAKTGKRLALANKEPIVVAGDILMQTAMQYNTEIIPVDSEHSAVFQCLNGEDYKSAEKIYLTASGGPFLNIPASKLENISIAEALNHPKWQMGKKISIDSATMMNKAYEIIEANRLFGVKPEQIDVIIHPESIIHSFVKFIDGSIKAQLSANDMRMQIKYAFTYPYRLSSEFNDFDILQLNNLNFLKPEEKHKKALNLAYYSLEKAGNMPAIINAADEFFVELFLKGKIKFNEIVTKIEETIAEIKYISNPGISGILQTDKETKQYLRLKYKI